MGSVIRAITVKRLDFQTGRERKRGGGEEGDRGGGRRVQKSNTLTCAASHVDDYITVPTRKHQTNMLQTVKHTCLMRKFSV